MEGIRSVLKIVHPEGWRFVGIFSVVTLVLFWIWAPLGWLGVVLTGWCGYFFRDPDRVTPTRDGLLVSPADGIVQMITEAPPPSELDMGDAPRTRVSVFMNVFNVHVNRVPANGTVTALAYHPGKFFNATLDKASEDNERQSVRMTTEQGKDVAFVQIAGLIARRIRCDLATGQTVVAGERFGLIRFGSRVDLYLDDGMAPLVAVGQVAVAGETVIADTRSGETARAGTVR